MIDESWPLEVALQERTSNCPDAALVKSQGSERLGKSHPRDGRYDVRRRTKVNHRRGVESNKEMSSKPVAFGRLG